MSLQPGHFYANEEVERNSSRLLSPDANYDRPMLELSGFTFHRGFGLSAPMTPRGFDLMPDGRILGTPAGASKGGPSTPPELRVVLNWFEELKARVQSK